MEPIPTSIYKMDYCGTNKNNFMCRREVKGHHFERMSLWAACEPWWCKTHHNTPKEVLLLAQLEA